MKNLTLFIAGLLLVTGCSSNGQQKKQNAPPGSVAPDGTGEIVQTIKEKRYNGLKPGDIAPDAVKLDIDKIKYIINGALVVEKGTQQALMNLDGKLLVPWGKFEFKEMPNRPFVAMIGAKDKKTFDEGYLNSKGEIAVPFKYQIMDFNRYKIAKVHFNNAKNSSRTEYGIIDEYGRFYPLTYQQYAYAYPDDNEYDADEFHNHRYYQNFILSADTFRNKSWKQTIPKFYYQARPFSNGLAAVSQKDQFGEIKWGYIDTTGKLVIPFTYSRGSGNFHNNRAAIGPQTRTTFNYAYIDKNNKIVFKVGDGSKSGFMGQVFERFQNGFLPGKSQSSLTDTNGVEKSLAETFGNPSLDVGKNGIGINEYLDLGFKVYNDQMPDRNKFGLIDLKGKMLFPMIFDKIDADYFSPYANVAICHDAWHNDYTYGIVNSQGVFVVIINKKSTF